MLVLHHCVHNARGWRDATLPVLEFATADGPALELLLHGHPRWARVDELPCMQDNDKLEIARALFVEGILALKPLEYS